MMKILLFLLYCNYFGFVEPNKPLSPMEWSKLAGGGFATSWFRSVKGFQTKYKPQNIQDVYARGFRNLRLRCRTGYPQYDMKRQIRELAVVVDDCIKGKVVPIVAWLNHRSEAEATTKQKNDYINWWTQVATAMKGKDYTLAYNLFEEIGLEKNPGPHCKKLNEEAFAKKTGEHFICPVVGGQSLRENLNKYVDWTEGAVKAIRAIDPYRIIILGSPRKTGEYLKLIPSSIYSGDKYMMAEWHIYASGPSKAFLDNGKPATKYWEGDGNKYGKKNVVKNLAHAKQWTQKTGVMTYFGAWMPQDNIKAELTQEESVKFIRYFVAQLKATHIPWTLNALEIYYNSATCQWYQGERTYEGMHITQRRNWSQFLTTTINAMGGSAPSAPAISNKANKVNAGSESNENNEGQAVSNGKKGKKGKQEKKPKKEKKGKGKKGKRGDSYHESIYDDAHERSPTFNQEDESYNAEYVHPRSPTFNREDEFYSAKEVHPRSPTFNQEDDFYDI